MDAGVVSALASMLLCGVAPLLYRRGLEGYHSVLGANFVRCLYCIPASTLLLLATGPVLHLSSVTVLLLVLVVVVLTSLVADTALLCSVRLVGARLAMA